MKAEAWGPCTAGGFVLAAVAYATLTACSGRTRTISAPDAAGELHERRAKQWGLVIDAPLEHEPLGSNLVELRGRAAVGTQSVWVSVDGDELRRASGTESWQLTLRLSVGAHRVVAWQSFRAHPPPLPPSSRAEGEPGGDVGDGTAEPWGASAEVRFHVGETLRLMDRSVAAGEGIVLRVDRFALERLLSPADQAAITVIDLDIRALVAAALQALWEPERHGIDTSAWGAAEHNLIRLLAMGPDNADLSGTALAPLLTLSQKLGLAPAQILSDMMGMAPSDRFLEAQVVQQALLDDLMWSHPAFRDEHGALLHEGRMRITLADALNDMAPLADRFGRAQAHPGFIAAPPEAELLTPEFALVMKVRGDLRIAPGLRPGEGYAAYVVTETTSADGAVPPVLRIDFEDAEAFQVEGLVPLPRVGLTLAMFESARSYDLPTGGQPRPRGSSAVWDAPPWSLEYIIADASFRSFAELFDGPRVLHYDLGAVSPAATVLWDGGHVTVNAVANLGPPPPPAFVWDLILDVAQRRLHDGGVDEGEANVHFELPMLEIGLDAAELVEEMRASLALQHDALVARMVGSASEVSGTASLWLDSTIPALRVARGAPLLHRDRGMLDAGVEAAPIGDVPTVRWTRSPTGARYALLIGTWIDGAVDVGMVPVPETALGDEEGVRGETDLGGREQEEGGP